MSQMDVVEESIYIHAAILVVSLVRLADYHPLFQNFPRIDKVVIFDVFVELELAAQLYTVSAVDYVRCLAEDELIEARRLCGQRGLVYLRFNRVDRLAHVLKKARRILDIIVPCNVDYLVVEAAYLRVFVSARSLINRTRSTAS